MDRDSLKLLLAQGLSLEEIGRRYGKHPSTVGYWVQKHGLEAAGRAKHSPKGGIAREVLEELVAQELTGREIAARLGVSLATVRHWLERYDLQLARVRYRQAAREGVPYLERSCRRHGRQRFRLVGDGTYRCPRCRAEDVAARRRRVKRILVEEAGGSCRVCGYDRNPAALQFHHLDRETKRFALSRDGVTISIDRARAEAAKCILLCANCHAEVEVGGITLPLDGAAA